MTSPLPSPPPSSLHAFPRDAALILLTMALGAAILGFRLGWQTYLWDEEVTLMFARMSWRELLVEHWGLDTHRPVYYALQKGWNSVFGESVAAMRMLPVVLHLALVPVFWRIAKEIEEGHFVTLSLVILVTSPMFLYQGRELRMYALLNLCLAGAMLCAVLLAKATTGAAPPRRQAGLVIAFSGCLAAAFYAQSLAVFVALLFAIWGGLAVATGLLPRRFLVSMLAAASLFLLFTTPAILPFLRHLLYTIGEGFWLPEPSFSWVYGQTMRAYSYPMLLKPVLAVLILLGLWSLLRRKPLWGLLVLVMVAGLPLIVLIVSLAKPLYMTRVIAWGSIVATFAIAAGLGVFRPALRWGGLAAVLAAHAGSAWTVYPKMPGRWDYLAFAEPLAGFTHGRDVFVLGKRKLLEPGLRWFYPELFEAPMIAFNPADNDRNVIDAAFRSTLIPRAEADTLALQGERLFVLWEYQHGQKPDPIDGVEGALAVVTSGWRPVESVQSGWMRLDIYARD